VFDKTEFMPYSFENKKTIFLITLSLSLILLATSCGSYRKTASSKAYVSQSQQQIIDYGRLYIGKPYRASGKGPSAFDCSGYTSFVFRKFGYNLSPSSEDQFRETPPVKRKEDLQVGDLVFFEGRAQNGKVGHVGIVTEKKSNGEFNFIHASTGNGVIVTSSSEPYYASRYLRGGRVLKEAAQDINKNKRIKNKQRKSKPEENNFFATNAVPKNEIRELQLTKYEPGSATGSNIPEFDNQNDQSSGSQSTITAPNSQIATESSSENSTTNTTNPILILPPEKQTMRKPEYANVPEPLEQKIDPDLNTDEDDNKKFTSSTSRHTVKAGETLYSISRKYNCSIEQIKQWNPRIGNILKAGEILNIQQIENRKK
jgi:cell wall-associated NlpC family hydrolase